MANTGNRLPTITLLKFLDLVLVIVSFVLATTLLVMFERIMPLRQFLSLRMKLSNVALCIAGLFVSHAVFSGCDLYRSRRLSGWRSEMFDGAKATTLLVCCFVMMGLVFSVKMFTLPFVALFWSILTVILCLSRLGLRSALGYMRSHGRNLRYVLILGTNARATDFARRVATHSELGYRVLGFVDDQWAGMDRFRGSGFQQVSDYAGLAEYLRSNVVDEVAIYLPLGSFYRHVSEVARLCEQHGIVMRFNSDIFGLQRATAHAEELDGVQYIATHSVEAEGWPLLVKRLLDVVTSFCLLTLLSPLFLAVALSIKLSSPGPVFFLQERIGINKRRFRMVKFRTMVPGAERLRAQLEAQNEASGPVFKIRNDPRVTPVGRFLRRSSLDELPQLLNVLKGDMSLVGPRPLPVRDYEGFNEDWQRRRFSVRPGITCLWQVKGRSNISFDQWMLLDLQYMDEWSIWLDLKILAKTVPAVLRGAGAA